MEVVVHDDDFGLVVANTLHGVAPFPSCFDRGLHSLCATVCREDHVHPSEIREGVAEGPQVRTVKGPGDEAELGDLLLRRGDDPRIRMSKVHCRIP